MELRGAPQRARLQLEAVQPGSARSALAPHTLLCQHAPPLCSPPLLLPFQLGRPMPRRLEGLPFAIRLGEAVCRWISILIRKGEAVCRWICRYSDCFGCALAAGVP